MNQETFTNKHHRYGRPLPFRIAHFFQVYKDLESKKVEIIGWNPAAEAKKVIIESIKRYKES